MKQTNILQTAVRNKITTTVAAVTVFFMAHPVWVQAQQQGGLNKAKTVLDTFKTQLNAIIPIAATIILLCLAVSYAGRFIEKTTFMRWAIGVIIAGSAAQITNMFFTP
ncbi:VirB2 family type IV secretion system major pilin TrwL [Bartonella alsatica]|uniref:Uncharacterized protein n=2 Tax=Bartonella alsatica TaxID=52764 RepID=J1IT06_9HYPH|nr:VirB2 family type IV secretion system major pilin TrwL [Bartonella alsatica]EJF74697.1 hypothetical protein MEC_01221 [Bartonella alsatica IBS 382]QLC51959.1 VirB2 family type IV secretion system major pilin TrwL [Bartonella alsatica]